MQKKWNYEILLDTLREYLIDNKTFTYNNVIYTLNIEDLELSYLSLTLTNDKDIIVLYLCTENCNVIAIDITYMSDMYFSAHIVNDEEKFFHYEENVICPTNDAERKQFICDLFNVFIPDILTDKHIKSICVANTDDIILKLQYQ